MQQGLGWNAADVETDATEGRVTFDQHHLLAEIGGAKRGGITTGAGAEHQHLGAHVFAAGGGRGSSRGRRGSRLGCSGRSGLGWRRVTGFDTAEFGALGHAIAHLDRERLDRAREGGRNVHRRLVGFERQDSVFDGYGIAGSDVNFDDLDRVEITDVRY